MTAAAVIFPGTKKSISPNTSGSFTRSYPFTVASLILWKSIEEDLDTYEPIKRGYGGAHYYDIIHFTNRLVSPHKIKAIAIFVANDITGKENGINNQTVNRDLSPKEVLRLVKFVTKEIRKSHAGLYGR